MCRVAGAGLSGYSKIAADGRRIGQAESFKIFVDNVEWDNFIVSFKDLPGYATYSTALISYKNVSPPLFAPLADSCGSHQIHDQVLRLPVTNDNLHRVAGIIYWCSKSLLICLRNVI